MALGKCGRLPTMNLQRIQENEVMKTLLVVCRRLFNEIMDNLYAQLNDRFGNIHRLGFVSLLDTTEFHSFKK
jgi:hypothetical protein